jgi:hypothetical protein
VTADEIRALIAATLLNMNKQLKSGELGSETSTHIAAVIVGTHAQWEIAAQLAEIAALLNGKAVERIISALEGIERR